ncbi:MAG: glycerol-3-phosphate acyltransferase [Acidimicrobiia bacterium]|nr:glycerol-3-phosphate acyltransferase [Acidimicrobiia bacterium]
MTVVAALAGYLIGSIPTANALAGMMGIDLRASGSTNPGAINARRLGGIRLAAAVLLVEGAKGALAVWVGSGIAGQSGMVAAGIGAVAGNVYNVWYRFGGGKGLGITLGVLAAAWPVGLLIALPVIAAGAAITRSSGIATIIALGVLLASALGASQLGLATPWGVIEYTTLPWLIGGLALVLLPKHVRDALGRKPFPA